MSATKSWQFLGGPGSVPYELYHAVRKRVNRKLVAYLTAKALQDDSSRVLEAGSGPAWASSLLARQTKVFSIALDIDVEALHEARRADPSLPLVAGDLYCLPFRTGVFDLVWNSSTLEHLEEPDRALAEMSRVAAQRGYVFVGVPYRWGLLGLQRWIKNTTLGLWLGSASSCRELIRMMDQCWLQPVDTILYCFGLFVGVLARKP